MAKDKFFIHKLTSEITKLTKEEKKNFPSYLNYNKKLKIILYGEPMADSRPRVSRGVAISINIGILRGFFIPLYKKDDLLMKTLIDSPFHLGFKFFMSPSKKIQKMIGYTPSRKKQRIKSKKIYDKFMKDELHDLSIKDCDNMVKIYNDLFMTEEARITLDDGFNIGLHKVDKYLSLNPRTEITVYYSDSPSPYFKSLMHDHYSFFKYRMSEKNMYIGKRTPKQQLAFLESLFSLEFKDLGSHDKIIDKLKQVLTYIEDNYSAKLLDSLVREIDNMKDYSKVNRTINTNILLLHLFRRNKYVTEILKENMKKYEKLINGGEEW